MSDPAQAPTKNKGGRPKGSKTRPQWLRDLERSMKHPTRGRPKGSKPKPKTIAGFLTEALLTAPDQRPLPVRPPRPPRPKVEQPEHLKAYRENLTPEQLEEIKRKQVENRRAKNGGHYGSRGEGTPVGWTKIEWAQAQLEAQADVKRIVKIMDQEGILPEDPLAREALETALKLMREPSDKDFKHKVLRTILEYRLAKPTTKQDVTVRTAEDWLASLADKDSDGSEAP